MFFLHIIFISAALEAGKNPYLRLHANFNSSCFKLFRDLLVPTCNSTSCISWDAPTWSQGRFCFLRQRLSCVRSSTSDLDVEVLDTSLLVQIRKVLNVLDHLGVPCEQPTPCTGWPAATITDGASAAMTALRASRAQERHPWEWSVSSCRFGEWRDPRM